jgi:integrase
LAPRRPRDISGERLSGFAKTFRDNGLSEATVGAHLRHVRSALKWAVDVGMLGEVPKVKRSRRKSARRKAKGCPVTGEEFERMLEAVEKTRGRVRNARKQDRTPLPALSQVVRSWRHLLEGLWLSGLRLGEAVDLSWDDPSHIMVELEAAEHPMLRPEAVVELAS